MKYILILSVSIALLFSFFFQQFTMNNPTQQPSWGGLNAWPVEEKTFFNSPYTLEKPVDINDETQRSANQTYLTFPEWYLVFSPDEYAQFLKTNQPMHQYPLMQQIGLLWQSYAKIAPLANATGFNGGYHMMINVIALSTTVEYLLKSVYENTIGRVSYLISGPKKSTGEKIWATYAQDYVDFIKVEPWYLFDFFTHLKTLFQTPLDGTLRDVERRFILSSELIGKGLYGKLIKLATQSAYEPAKPRTLVAFTVNQDTGPYKANQVIYAYWPRYQAFSNYLLQAAQLNATLVSVAGNSNQPMLLSFIRTKTTDSQTLPQTLFTLPMAPFDQPTPYGQRIVVQLPINEVIAFINQHPELSLEHAFDY